MNDVGGSILSGGAGEGFRGVYALGRGCGCRFNRMFEPYASKVRFWGRIGGENDSWLRLAYEVLERAKFGAQF
jgi:hypothetical protein